MRIKIPIFYSQSMQDYFFQVCDIMDALATGRKKRLVNCAACCNDAPNQNVPCNANLCGLGKLINDLLNTLLIIIITIIIFVFN